MSNAMKTISIALGGLALSACTAIDDNMGAVPPRYTYDVNPSYSREYYPREFYTRDYRMTSYTIDNPKTVLVPNSYHVGQTPPVASKELDKTWVNGQNSQGYTIEIADGEKASQVANTLYKAPKNERMAQVKYQRDGKTYYKGLYGSYESPQAAQKALEALPAEIKQGAGVKNWGAVKGAVGE